MRFLLNIYPGDDFALLLANVAVQVTAVMLLALVASFALRKAGAAARYGVWLAAMCAVLLSPVTAWTADRVGLSLITIPLANSEAPAPEPALIAPVAPVAQMPEPAPQPAPAVTPEPTPWSAAERERESEPSAVPPLSRVEVLRGVFTGLFALWCAGALFMLARLIYGWGVAAALRRSVRSLSAPGFEDVLAEVRGALGVEKLPRIVTTELIGSPISVGVLRPMVILPKNLPFMIDGDELRDVLVHECAHVMQRDHLVGLLQRIIECFLWPHPLVYKMHRELARAREEICDNFVLRKGDGPSYAKNLLDLAEKTTVFHRMPATVGLSHPRWTLEERVAGILDRRRKLMTRMNLWALGAVAVVFLGTGIIIAGCRTARKESRPAPLDKAAEARRLFEKALRFYVRGRPGMPDANANLRMADRYFAQAGSLFEAILKESPGDDAIKDSLLDVARLRYTCRKMMTLEPGKAVSDAVAVAGAPSVGFHLVPPGKEKRSGLYAIGLGMKTVRPAAYFSYAADGKMPGPVARQPITLIGKLPYRTTTANFFVAGPVKIEAGTVSIFVKFAHYRGPLAGKSGTPCHTYATVSLPALPVGKHKATLVFSDYAYQDLRLREKDKLVHEADRPARTLTCEFEVRAAGPKSLTEPAQKFELGSCPSISGGDYSPGRAVRAANAIIAMGEKKAYEFLKSQARIRSGRFTAERIAVLCTLLYRTTAIKPLRAPRFGGPNIPYRSMSSTDWPTLPLTLSRGVPFLMVSGYSLAGHAEPAAAYLEYCKKNGRFKMVPYKAPTEGDAEKAMAELFASPRWKRIRWKDSGQGWSYDMSEEGVKDRLRKQVARMSGAKVSWGKAANGLRVGLSVKKKVFEAGKSMGLTFHLKNVAKGPISIGNYDLSYHWGYVFRPKAAGVPRIARYHGPMAAREAPRLTLAAGQEKTVRLTLDPRFWRFDDARSFLDPGKTYELQQSIKALTPDKYAVTASFTHIPPDQPPGSFEPSHHTGAVEIEVKTVSAKDSPSRLTLEYVQTADPVKDATAALARGKPYFMGYMGVGLVVPALPKDARKEIQDGAPQYRTHVVLPGKARKHKLVMIDDVTDVITNRVKFEKAWAYAKNFNRTMGKLLGQRNR
jgi:beta-lactamase regulating signal transducer with metallopeptidase domain